VWVAAFIFDGGEVGFEGVFGGALEGDVEGGVDDESAFADGVIVEEDFQFAAYHIEGP